MPTLDRHNVTFCTGYWHIQGNTKHNLAHYLKYIPRTCRLIRGNNLILFYEDDRKFELFKRYAQRYRIKLVGIKIAVTDLPIYSQSKDLLAACKAMDLDRLAEVSKEIHREKGYIHLHRDYLSSGEDNYRKVISIWMSKIPLVVDFAIKQNPFNTDYFAWVDATISRFSKHRHNWNFMRLGYDRDALFHYKGKMHYQGRQMNINASFLLANVNDWQTLHTLFMDKIRESFGRPYAHDEETLLNEILHEHPGLFHDVGRLSYQSYLDRTKNYFRRLMPLSDATRRTRP